MMYHFRHQIYDYTHFYLAGLYFLLFVIDSIIFLRSSWKGNLKENWKKFFHIFLLSGCSLRCGFFYLQPFVREGYIQLVNRENSILNLFPSYFFFSNYLIILVLWAEIIYYPENTIGQKPTINKFRNHLIFFQVLMYIFAIVLFLLYFTISSNSSINVPYDATIYEILTSAFIGVIYVTFCFCYLFFGVKSVNYLHSNMDKAKGKEKEKISHVIRKVLSIVCLISSCFFLRSILVFENMWINFSAIPYFDAVYYTVMEVVPLLLMLLILNWRHYDSQSKTSNERSYLVNSK
eukprot:TRINITY_DN4183_c0_g1_i2.p1 TRINITY_DN4183_c0_g1~~TRINITY_DN4183_c0_g1_i2.p1  ORF type:complete len:291 (-),score=26.49 TRINITY_DN4183_c0_g1_i2:47-919(-)